jgi:UDP-perosamine 4-acetyltransferase
MKTAYIIGAGGQGKVIESIIQHTYEQIIFIDSNPIDANIIHQNYFLENLQNYKTEHIFIGIGDNSTREKIYNTLIATGIIPQNCISSHSFIANNASIGNGVVICPGAVIGAKAIIGNNTIINTLSSIDHESIIGEHCHIAPGVNIGGTSKVGKNTFIGIKSALINNIEIGEHCFVMAGSVVCHNFKNNVQLGGIPAKIIKHL